MIKHPTANKAKPKRHSLRMISNSPNSINMAGRVRTMAKTIIFAPTWRVSATPSAAPQARPWASRELVG